MSKSKGKKSDQDSASKSNNHKPTARRPVGVIVAILGAVAAIVVAIIQKVPIPPIPPLPTPTLARECSIKNLGWQEYTFTSKFKSTINVSPVLNTYCEIRILFDLKAEEYVSVYKKLEPNLLLQSQGIRFSYVGTGVANTLEFKLIEIDTSNHETIFYVQWCGATSSAGEEILQEIKYSDMACMNTPNSNCKAGRGVLRPALVDRIDFSFSNKPTCGDKYGQGEITIKGIQIIP